MTTQSRPGLRWDFQLDSQSNARLGAQLDAQSNLREFSLQTSFVFLIALVCLSTLGCSTVAPITNINLSFNTVRGIVTRALPGGLKVESPNGRDFKSAYYQALKGDKFVVLDGEKAESVSQRNFMKATINGDRRPYSIEVRIYTQSSHKGSHRFSSASLDEVLTDEMIQRIRDTLANRRDDGNVIDEFRAF